MRAPPPRLIVGRMKPAGLFLIACGALVLTQIFGGQALERFGLLHGGDGLGTSPDKIAKGIASEGLTIANPGMWLGGKVADLVTK